MAKEEPQSQLTKAAQEGDLGFVYLDAVRDIEIIQTYKRRCYALLEVQPGYRILDVGCGTGDDVIALAQLAGRTGWVVGVDINEHIIEEAKKRSEGLNLSVEYHVCDAHQLDFADNTFDCCRADRSFLYVENPRQALSEMIRVAKHGAKIVVTEPDWGTLVIDAPNRALTRKILDFLCDSIRNGWMGRQLLALYRECGLTDVAVAAETLFLPNYDLANQILFLEDTVQAAQQIGIVSTEDSVNWLHLLKEADQNGRFFCAVTGFGASGRKP